MPVTPAQLRSARPQFAAVSDWVVQQYLDQAVIGAGPGWPDWLQDQAQIAYACHLMTLDGLGTDPASQSFASGHSEFQSIRSGAVTLTRFRSSAEAAGHSYSGWLAQTPCGRQFLVWLRSVRGGPRVAMGGVGRGGVGAYAKDWPLLGWGF